MFESFKQRSTQSELIDDQAIGYPAFRDCLHDLAVVNVLTLAYRPTLHWLGQAFQTLRSKQPISVIDVGSGGGDTLRQIAQWAKRRKYKLNLTGVDLNPWSKRYADTQAALGIKFEVSDIFDFDPGRRADFIISSIFTHHLKDEQLLEFLKWMERHAAQGWFINDLHRHPLAYYLFKYVSRLLRFNYMVQHDGAISVARAFTKADWVRYLKAASIPSNEVEIRWYFPFRYCVARRKS